MREFPRRHSVLPGETRPATTQNPIDPKKEDRIYLLVDPENPTSTAILPISLTGSNKLPRGANRLDALVLGPEILKTGARGQGMIEEATQIRMSNPLLEA